MKTKRSFFKSIFCIMLVISAISLFPGAHTLAEAGQTEYVIVISVDGGGASYIQNLIDSNLLPNFKRFQTEGAWTNNARNDYDYTVTLPNHVTIVTARGILGINSNGHGWISNSDPSNTPTATNYSIQNNKGSYVSGVFDVVHDNGLRTALYATKTKFSLFDHSYNNGNGALDTTGSDNGLNKIDAYVYYSSSQALTTSFITAMQTNPYNYVLVHFTDGDTYGHANGWGSTQYNNAIVAVDGYLGQIFDLVTNDPVLRGKTSIILTADHGGTGTGHSTATDPFNYTIPVYIWGPDVQATSVRDLYALNSAVRLYPGTGRPAYTDLIQPIRHAESANLALRMLSLGTIPGSTINNAQDLGVNSNPPSNGVCGSANGHTLSAPPPTADLCYIGIPSSVTGTGPWAWKCIGLYLGINASCKADYAIPIYRGISVNMAGTGVGTVTSSPSGIACTSGSGSGCSSSFVDGTLVRLTAIAGVTSLFSGWSNCNATDGTACLMVMSSDKTVIATFSLKQYLITVTGAGVNGGTISDGSVISATWNGSALSGTKTRTVNHGSGPYTITATAIKGVTVTWSGNCDSVSGNKTGTVTCTINAGIAAAKNVKATFSKTKGRQ